MKNRHKGGILLTALLFTFLFSFIFILVLEDFKLSQHFSVQTKDYYTAKTIARLFVSTIKKQKVIEKSGRQQFSEGILEYEYDKKTLKIIININKKYYQFQERYQLETVESSK
ncbi:competence type IV pilus minor pilin ComGG [Candidatus Enterococcus mansonii]|uniref:Late competence protein ComGG n=1 Tax=Candidatus Enterococcus mansonii TaxID=1834181 RepID=A0A242CHZ7_9ENTE|nr:competence type IV pilus minor pilin ComGG [Enterococcus sp. 4G2_DIV0659]OTO09855.1 hypothetical protein A5880_000538 [Enterococcus sp. 4G2_DIV0659]